MTIGFFFVAIWLISEKLLISPEETLKNGTFNLANSSTLFLSNGVAAKMIFFLTEYFFIKNTRASN